MIQITFAHDQSDAPSAFLRSPRLARPAQRRIAVTAIPVRTVAARPSPPPGSTPPNAAADVPDLAFSNWRDPTQVRYSSLAAIPAPGRGLDVRSKLAADAVRRRVRPNRLPPWRSASHRFAFSRPERVAGVVASARGIHRLPLVSRPDAAGAVSLPPLFGAAAPEAMTGRMFATDDVRPVAFLLGVGDRDDSLAAPPPRWGPYLGSGRLRRAPAFNQALLATGARSQ